MKTIKRTSTLTLCSEHNITLADLDGLGLEDFDPAEYITSDEAAAAYLTEALAANNAAVFASAVGVVARARGIAEHQTAPFTLPREEQKPKPAAKKIAAKPQAKPL